jgi:hypothetical protein
VNSSKRRRSQRLILSVPIIVSGESVTGHFNEQKTNQIELVILVGENKARVENWQIVGTVTTTPSTTLTSGSR